MNSEKLLVSVIISCYNSGPFLSKTIESILLQDYKYLELIFVNDGSSDDSLSIAESFALLDTRIKIFSTINRGLNAARNFGAKQVSEESAALMFVDADDILDRKAIEILQTALFSEEETGAAYCDFKIINSKGEDANVDLGMVRLEPTRFWVKKIPRSVKYTSLFSIYSWTFMQEACTLIKKEIFVKFGGWDEKDFPKGDTFGESIPLFGQIAINHKIIFINQKLYLYRKHGDQITSNNFDYRRVQNKVNTLMLAKTANDQTARKVVIKAIRFVHYRLPFYKYIKGSWKHELRFYPLKAMRNISITFARFAVSLFFRFD